MKLNRTYGTNYLYATAHFIQIISNAGFSFAMLPKLKIIGILSKKVFEDKTVEICEHMHLHNCLYIHTKSEQNWEWKQKKDYK